MRGVTIYCLKHPITEIVRYVGQTYTDRIIHRKYEHNSRLSMPKYPKDFWIQKLHKQNLKPIFEILDEVDVSLSDQAEQSYIRLFKSFGAQLLNLIIGGDTAHGSINHYAKLIKGKTLEEIHGIEKALQIKLRMSQVTSGVNNPNYGRKFGPEVGEQSRLTQSKKPLLILDRQNNILGEFRNSKEAADFIGCNYSRVRYYKIHGWYVNRKYLIIDKKEELIYK